MTTNWTKQIKYIWDIVRFPAWFDYSIYITLIGFLAAYQRLTLPLFVLAIFHIFAINAFMFLINDVEDASDDAKDPKKKLRNHIANGNISEKLGYIYTAVSFGIALFTGILLVVNTKVIDYKILGLVVNSKLLISVVLGLNLFLGFIYSWRKIRAKARLGFDVVTHAFMLAGGQFLMIFLSLNTISLNPNWAFFIPAFLVSMYGQLQNQIRDFTVDKLAKLKTVTITLGITLTRYLQFALILTALCLSLILFDRNKFKFQLDWSDFVVFAILVTVFTGYALIRNKYLNSKHIFINDLQRAFGFILIGVLLYLNLKFL